MNLLSCAEAICPSALRPILNRVKTSLIGRRIASGAFWSVLGNGVGKGLTFLSMVLVARILGPKTFGEFGLVRSTAMTFAVLSSSGMGWTATKYIAELLPSDKERVGRIIGMNYIFTGVSSLLVAVVFWFAAPWVCNSVLQSSHLSGMMRLGAVLLFLMTFCTLQQGILAGFQDFRRLAFSNIICGMTMVPIYIAGAYYWGLTGAIIGMVIAAGLGTLVNCALIWRNTKHHSIRCRFSQVGCELGILSRFSFPAVLGSIVYGVSFWGCQMVFGAQQDGTAQLGVFYAAFTVFTALITVPSMLSPLYVAILSELLGKGNMKRFRKTVLLSLGTNVSIGSVLALPFLCIPSQLMVWCFGESFRDASGTLALLSLTAFLYVIDAVAYQVLTSMGRLWLLMGCSLGGVVTTLFVTYLTAANWGSSGLALALLAGYCVRLILMFFFVLNRVIWENSLGFASK